jgi:tRNA A-37 threonylcarbamoyl transferase component Bud32
MTDSLRDSLERGDWNVPLPITLVVDGSDLQMTECLRLLPGKRVTLAASWRKQKVIAKLFLPQAAKEQTAEISGFAALSKANIATPQLLWSGSLDNGMLAVVYQKLGDVESLASGVKGPKREAFLTASFELLSKMHRAGLWQADIHLDNFLLAAGSLHVIDNASIKLQEKSLSPEQSIDNMAAFIAQFPWRERAAILRSPTLGLPISADKQTARSSLDERSRDIWWKRADNYLKKVFRNCTDIAVVQQQGWYVAHQRKIDAAWLEGFKSAPDSVMVKGELIKDGNSATVVRCKMADRSVIIKRYNIKNIGHRVRRLLRETRASNAWRAAHLLQMAGIQTPEPLVLLEQRRGPLRGVSYLVTADAGGEEMMDAYRQRDPSASELEAVREIFRVMGELQLCHGDFKAKNFLVTDSGIQLIDLDVLHAVSSPSRFARCALQDKERFLRNWYAHPAMESRFKTLLTQPDGG